MISAAQGWELAGKDGWEWREHLQRPFIGCLTPHNPITWALLANMSGWCHLVELTGITTDLC